MFVSTSFEESIMHEIDSMASLNKLKFFTFGSVTGPSGGGGVNPFNGPISQRFVTFDTTEDTSESIPSGASLLNNLNRIRGGFALGDQSIIQRHIYSGVGTLDLTDGLTTLEDVLKVRFLNSYVSGTRDNALVEIIAVSSGYYSLPDMTGHENEYLTNNGSVPFWALPIGRVSTVFGREGDIVATSGDYDHNQLNNHGVHPHSDVDIHLDDVYAHLPSGTGFPGAFLMTDGTAPHWIFPSGFGHNIMDNGLGLPSRTNLNFIGFSVVDDSGLDATTITYSGGGGSNLATIAESKAGIINDKATTPAGLPLRVEDGALINNQSYGGDTRGTNAIDLQSVRDSSDQVASGVYSAILHGANNIALGSYSQANGLDAKASQYGQLARAAGKFSVTGDAQSSEYILRRTIDFSVNTGWQSLYLDGASLLITMPNNSVWTFDVMISASTSGVSDYASYHINGSASCIGNLVSVDNATFIYSYETNALWNVSVDGTNQNLLINVTDGSDTETIRWVAVVRTSELIYP